MQPTQFICLQTVIDLNIPTLSNTSKVHLTDTFHHNTQQYLDKESWGVSQEKRYLHNTKHRVAYLRKRISSRAKFSNEYLKPRNSRMPLKSNKTQKRRYSSDFFVYSLERFSKRTTRTNLKYLVDSQEGSLQTPQDRSEHMYCSNTSLNSKPRPTHTIQSNPTANRSSTEDPIFVKVKPVEISRVSLLSRMIQTRPSSTLEKNAERRRLLKAMRRHSVDITGNVSEISDSDLGSSIRASTHRAVNRSRYHLETYFESSINVW
ncbi:hypothetical protein K7432_007707 [Basidiobolus ranarum]|uniref:Uncharacterized protein n=1 Tax=Basidiobolus ranarum TaxID=34480 RepID=A0ABR2WT02_9FUNG